MTMPDRIAAYVDESGQPSRSGKSSAHFVMGAMMVRRSRLHEADDWLVHTKRAVNRRPQHELHWNRVKTPEQRIVIANGLGSQTWGRFTAVVVCKKHLTGSQPLKDDESYLYTLRYLCERLSWFGRSHGMAVDLTIAHKIRFKRENLARYEHRLRSLSDCEIDWRYLDLSRAKLTTPARCSPLQIADSFVSSLANAFEPDNGGTVHSEYLHAYAARLYRGPQHRKPTVYGVKVHPSHAVGASHGWLREI